MAERDVTPVEITLDRQRPYRANDEDRDAIWVGPGLVSVPLWVAEAWGHAVSAPTHDGAPIDSYDALSVRDILAMLPGLDDEQKHAVAEYEAANRNRKTVLEAVGNG